MRQEQPATYVLGMLADPGIAQQLAERARGRLERVLNGQVVSGDRWEITLDRQPLPLSSSGRVLINKHAAQLYEQGACDFVVYLTDIPQYVKGRPVRMIISAKYRVATIVVPMLGLARTRTVVRWVLQAVNELYAGGHTHVPSVRLPRNLLSLTGSVVHEQEPDDRFSTVEGLTGRLLLMIGLVRVNRPWRLIPRLSSAMAGAAATGAFGLFYTSIWQMADYLSGARLALISLTSITILTMWLVWHNNLWERPRGARRRERLVLYNLATLVTVALAATVMYLMLFVILLIGAVVVIDVEFLSVQLGHQAGTDEYLNLIWLAASLGTLGSAIGSSFDDEQSVRQATFSQREFERRNLKDWSAESRLQEGS